MQGFTATPITKGKAQSWSKYWLKRVKLQNISENDESGVMSIIDVS